MNFGLSVAGDMSDFRGSLMLQLPRQGKGGEREEGRHERERETERDR